MVFNYLSSDVQAILQRHNRLKMSGFSDKNLQNTVSNLKRTLQNLQKKSKR